MLTKRKLKTLWNKYGFRPLKRLGQNFLIDKNVKDKILKNLDIEKDDIVIEIGAGFGELTFDLAGLAKKVFAVERDKKIAQIFKNEFEVPHNLVFIEKDFLDVDIKKIGGGKKVIVYGSLPYYITSPIIEKLIMNISAIKTVYIIVQKEVGQRIFAHPGSKDIGRLTLYVQYHAKPERLFKIRKESFFPTPQVDSVFLKLDRAKRKNLSVRNEEALFRIIKSAYGQRRKTILNSLASTGLEKDKLSQILRIAKINPSCRAEDLSLEDFARLTNCRIYDNVAQYGEEDD